MIRPFDQAAAWDATADAKGRPTLAVREVRAAEARPVPPAVAEYLVEQHTHGTTPAELMRDAVRQETDEAFARIAGEARLHGLAEELDEGWVVCVCANGRHDPLDRASDVLPTEDEADREHLYVAASHVIRLRRMVLNAPPEVTR